jgi:hypothetical protein
LAKEECDVPLQAFQGRRMAPGGRRLKGWSSNYYDINLDIVSVEK